MTVKAKNVPSNRYEYLLTLSKQNVSERIVVSNPHSMNKQILSMPSSQLENAPITVMIRTTHSSTTAEGKNLIQNRKIDRNPYSAHTSLPEVEVPEKLRPAILPNRSLLLRRE